MEKTDVYKREFEKLTEIFKDIDESKKKLAEGLIENASCLYAENYILRKLIEETGMVKVHPVDKTLQKPLEAGTQFLKISNSYSVIIKTLNSILQKNVIEEDDTFDLWLKEKMNKNE